VGTALDADPWLAFRDVLPEVSLYHLS
jgi:hypothetical protein